MNTFLLIFWSIGVFSSIHNAIVHNDPRWLLLGLIIFVGIIMKVQE